MKHLARLIIASISLSFSLHSHAIVMRHDISVDKYQVKQAQYPSVVDLNFLTGTLIAPQWILTAAHGVPYMPSKQTVSISQQTYQVDFIIRHPEYNKDNLSHDIALLKINRPVVNVRSTPIYTKADEQSQHVWFVGKGDTGNGKIGIMGSSTALNHAENLIDSAEGLWITFDFDAPDNNALPLEGISGPGDSGGPAFITTPSGLQVAGVSSHQRDNDKGEGLYGVKEYYTRTSAHLQWLEKIMSSEDMDLAELAINRPIHSKVKASEEEIIALIGRYQLIDGTDFFIEPCLESVCYRWANSTHQTEIAKTTEAGWFAPTINRYFTVHAENLSQVSHIIMYDFHGERKLSKQDENGVTALKNRIKTRGRELLTHVEPIWPKKAIDEKIEGSVTMSFSINTDGSVNNIKIIKSTPSGIFEKASITAISQWQYAKLDKPLTDIKTQFDFTL